MKQVLLAALVVFGATQAGADENTLVGGKIRHGVYAAPTLKITSVNGDIAVMSGSVISWIANNKFAVGFTSCQMANELDATDEAAAAAGFSDLDMDFHYGGIHLEYMARPSRLVHCSFSTMIGGGSVSYNEQIEGVSGLEQTDALFIIEPAVSAELNVTSWMRLNAGVSYRVAGDCDVPGLEDADLSGPAASFMVKFGKL